MGRYLLTYLQPSRRLQRTVFVLLCINWIGINTWIGHTYFGRNLYKSYSLQVLDKHGRLLRAYLTPDDKWRFDRRSTTIPASLLEQLTCIEDKRFWWHWGLDPIAALRATMQNVSSRGVVSGASTITMQLARLVHPQARTLSSKALEAYVAWLYEIAMSKKDILDHYTNYAPYGGNVEGIATASYRYFMKPLKDLNSAEIAQLFLLHQTPSRRFRLSASDWQDLTRTYLERMADCDTVATNRIERLVTGIKHLTPYRFPMLAPHISDELVAQERSSIRSTIDLEMQRTLEQKLRGIRSQYWTNNVHNISVLVVEHGNGEVRAAAGNFDYLMKEHDQNFASYRVWRSPGSTLKPFLYAMAIEQGLLLPNTLVEDIPTNFKDYRPQNYSGEFSGLVPAKEALAKSLNIPFVEILRKLGLSYAYERFLSSGLAIRQTRDEVGLSLAIGGIETTPWAMTQLYTSLANDGEIRALRTLANTSASTHRLLQPGSTYMTNEALMRRDRPDYPKRSRFARPRARIKWKTGTSQGRRDAWSIGIGPKYLISVWTGNLNQSSSTHLVGSEAASPLMFDLFSMFDSAQDNHAAIPVDLIDLKVCEYSGLPATQACPSTKYVMAMEDRVPAHRCPFHRNIRIDIATGLRVGPHCNQGASQVKSILQFNPRIWRWLDRDQKSLAPAQQWHPECKESGVRESSIAIKQPVNQQEFFLMKSAGQTQLKLPVEFESTYPLAMITCFYDGVQYSASSLVEQGYIQAGKGSHALHCIDPDGITGESRFRVQ